MTESGSFGSKKMKTMFSRLQFVLMTALAFVLLGAAALAQTATTAPSTPIQSRPVPAQAVAARGQRATRSAGHTPVAAPLVSGADRVSTST